MSILNPNSRRIKLGFIGTGNMGQIFLSSVLKSGNFDFHNIYVTNRSRGKLDKVQAKFGVQTLSNNEDLVEMCDIIFATMKPQDFVSAFEPINNLFDNSKILVSLAAGISIKSIMNLIPDVDKVFRVMPNTPSKIGEGIIGYSCSPQARHYEDLITKILSPMGEVVAIEEGELFEALTVACGSGVGFVFEMMIYWQEWLEEHGFNRLEARKLTMQTFLGAAMLAKDAGDEPLEELQRRVVSKKGVTDAGLNEIRATEIERLLRLSFEKAVLRDRDLGKLNL